MNTVGATPCGKRVVALRHAARHLEVDALVVERLLRDQLRDDRRPFGGRMRIGEADAVEAALQAGKMLRQAERRGDRRRGSARRRRRRR